MQRLVLTENQFSTIINALSGMAEVCRKDAANAPDTPEGKHLAAAVTESAKQYDDLALSIAEADEIVVDT